ncbi:hypothetical protein CEE37_05800 [candidate division LCP-89 bacterium B3_LCP]|uniref:Integrase n=1 Tax=candidate division LCP-89 bacterium B3_LCP TaxID=2012998 RepID=A0A532V2F8_UNCL8|nr:MAG: hypothetical protein CEE37_05800 [candidate division LCP-89 bacterium B3_LCP]
MNANPALNSDGFPVNSGSPSLENIREVADDFFSHLNERTCRTYQQGLKDFAQFIGENEIFPALLSFLQSSPVEAYRTALRYQTNLKERGLSPGTINTRLTALRALVRFMQVMGLIQWELRIKNVPTEAFRDTSGPTQVVFLNMLETARKQQFTPKAKRDVAILMLHRYLGLRRGAIVNLDLEDVNLDSGTIAVLEKGKLEKRIRTLPEETKKALGIWIEERGNSPGALFYNLHRNPEIRKRITGTGVYHIVRTLGAKVGVKTRPHAIRHSSVTDLLELTNGNITGVQQFAGHKDVRTTSIYNDNRKDEAGRLAKLLEEWDKSAKG